MRERSPSPTDPVVPVEREGGRAGQRLGGNLLPSIRQRLSRLLQNTPFCFLDFLLDKWHYTLLSVYRFCFVKFPFFTSLQKIYYLYGREKIFGSIDTREKREGEIIKERREDTSYHSLERGAVIIFVRCVRRLLYFFPYVPR